MKQEKEKKNAEISARIMKVVEYLGETANSFALKLGYQRAQTIYDIRDMKSAPSYDFFKRFSNAGYSVIINLDWLLTGEGTMLREPMKQGTSGDEPQRERKLIPFYDDVATIGGKNSISASMDGHMPGNEWIDAGDWFTDATAAIRHYGDSMNEYPSGCILALKELHDKRQIVWGRNYCIETDEMRVTKRLQLGTEDYLMAYSSNTDTYPDGHLIHEPFPIYKSTIRRIFMVIGCVIKEYSSGPVMIKK